MGNLVIAKPTLSDAATITPGAQVSSMPASNLQTIQPGDVWRCTDLANSYLVVDLLSATAINLVALLFTNASSVATMRVRGATSVANLTASPGYDSGAVSHWPTTGLDTWDWTHFFLWFGSSPKTFRYWRLDIADAANAAGYYQAGRLYMASAWQPTRNMAYGWSVGFDKGSATDGIGAGGQTYPVNETTPRIIDLTLPYLSESEMMANGFELDRTRGVSKDVLAIRDPDVAAYLMQESIYGKQIDRTPIVNSAFSLFEKRIAIREFLP